MASSKRRASIISFLASLTFFFIIISQVPLFSVPCMIGICQSPIELTSSHLLATELFPVFGVKALLYPGAIAKAYIKGNTIPSYSKLLRLHNFTNSKRAFSKIYVMHLEILAGSYLTVAGALLGLLRPGRMSLLGTLLIMCGSFRRRSDKLYHIFPATMLIAVLCAFLSIRKDVRTLIHSFKAQRGQKYRQLKIKL